MALRYFAITILVYSVCEGFAISRRNQRRPCCCEDSVHLKTNSVGLGFCFTNAYLDSLSSSGGGVDASSDGIPTSPPSYDKNSSHRVPLNTPARQSLPSSLILKDIPGKGLGVVTKSSIPKNTVVGDYVGECLTAEVKDRRYLTSLKHLQHADDVDWAKRRQERGQTITGCYLYGVTMPGDADPIYIDAEDEFESLWTRFLNHSTPPGNNLNPKSIHQSFDEKPRVWFVSNRDIEPNEELCFDYGDDYWLPGDEVL